MPSSARNHYDHRIRQAIVKTGDAELFPRLDIPDSTKRSWIKRGIAKVVTLEGRGLPSQVVVEHGAWVVA